MNPDDAFFPWVRHKDFYAGHSWGSGLSVMVDGVYQESVSLAGGARGAPARAPAACAAGPAALAPPRRCAAPRPLAARPAPPHPRPPRLPAAPARRAANSYYALSLLGVALNDTQMANFGKLMLAMEVRAAQKYWYISSQSVVYAPPFSNNKLAGILWSTKVGAAARCCASCRPPGGAGVARPARVAAAAA